MIVITVMVFVWNWYEKQIEQSWIGYFTTYYAWERIKNAHITPFFILGVFVSKHLTFPYVSVRVSLSIRVFLSMHEVHHHVKSK